MAAAAWFERFRLQHDQAKRGALAGRELIAYIAARDELARALLSAQRMSIPAGAPPRRGLRVARALHADIDLGGRVVKAVTLDVSAGGFATLLESAPRLGDEALVTLRLPDPTPLRATARVASAKAQTGSVRVGFVFVGLSRDELERLERFVFDCVLAQMG
jgi:hypothetical protein